MFTSIAFWIIIFIYIKFLRYDIGKMTDLVYAVDGGLEDYVYGAGWENTINP